MSTLLVAALLPHQRRVFVVDITDGDRIVEQIIDTRMPWSGFVLVSTVTRNPEQPRKLFDEEEIALLAGSIQTTLQVSPITAVIFETPEDANILWMINDGERRLRAMKLIDGKVYLWIAYNPFITAENLFKASTIANLCRTGHTYMENAGAINRLLEMDSGSDYKTIAKQMGFGEGWVKQLHSLMKLHVSLQPLLDAPTPKQKRIPIGAAFTLASVEQGEQLEIWGKVKHLPKRQMSVQISALAGAAKTAAGKGYRRKPSYNARIVGRKIISIKVGADEALLLPCSIFEKIPAEKKPELLAMIGRTRELLDQIEERLGSKEEPGIAEQAIPGEPAEETAGAADAKATAARSERNTSLPARDTKPQAKKKKLKSLAELAHASSIRARPLPPGPSEIRAPADTAPAQGTPAELPKAEIREDPDIALQRTRERIEEERRALENIPARHVSVYSTSHGGESGNGLVRRGLTTIEIISNIKQEQAAARARIHKHQVVRAPRNSLKGLQEGQGFTARDFARGEDDYQHGAGG